jgi:hypothetical protein
MATRSIRVVSLGAEQVDAAAAVMARAFQHDPLFVYIYPDPAERVRHLPWISQSW